MVRHNIVKFDLTAKIQKIKKRFKYSGIVVIFEL